MIMCIINSYSRTTFEDSILGLKKIFEFIQSENYKDIKDKQKINAFDIETNHTSIAYFLY